MTEAQSCPDDKFTTMLRTNFHLQQRTCVVQHCCCSLNQRRCDMVHGVCLEKCLFFGNLPTLKHDNITAGHKTEWKKYNQKALKLSLTSRGISRQVQAVQLGWKIHHLFTQPHSIWHETFKMWVESRLTALFQAFYQKCGINHSGIIDVFIHKHFGWLMEQTNIIRNTRILLTLSIFTHMTIFVQS